MATAIGCSGSSSEPAAAPSDAYTETPCPPDVAGAIAAPVMCGYLTVPESRAEANRTIRVFVTRVEAPESATDAEPVLVAGTDLGAMPNYAGIGPMAERVGRDVIIVDARGTGHSEPTLDCPEVEDLADDVLAAPTDDAATQARYLDAAAACHQRLDAEGIDTAAYNLTEMAADAEDLRRALGVDSWNVATFGTASRIAVEMLRSAPEAIRAVVLDSPDLPGTDPRAEAITATRRSLTELLAACSADPSCAAAFPDAQASLPRALTQLETAPVPLELADHPPDGRTLTVHLDDALLLRLVRQMLTDTSQGGRYQPGAVPLVLDTIIDGRTPELAAALAVQMVGDPPYCTGYQPRCLPNHRLALGVVYTTLCHDIVPSAGTQQPPTSTSIQPSFARAYGHSPLLDICDHWPAGNRTSHDLGEPVHSDVPVLALFGAFDPYTDPDAAAARLGDLTDLQILIDPAGTHNVLPRTPCTLDIRRTWLDHPDQQPDTTCLATQHIDWQLT